METGSRDRGVLTMAYGHPRFIEQAKDLGLSLRLHAPDLPRAIVTDSMDAELRSIFTDVIPLQPEYGSGVGQKLYLDRYSPYETTLFIDSDCLVLGSLLAFWAAFQGRYFGVPGYRHLHRGDKDPYMDVDHVLDRFGVTALPKFNGGTYYFTRSAEATRFFETARHLMDQWRELRLAPFRRNGPNDEAVYSIAMAIHGMSPTYMANGGMWTPTGYRGRLRLDGIAGTCSFEKEGQIRTPEIIHFPGEYAYCYPYARERVRIRKQVQGRGPGTPAVGRAYAAAALWHPSRRSAGLSKLGKNAIRAWRTAGRSASARGGQA